MNREPSTTFDVRAETIQWLGDALDVGTFTVDRDLVVTSWNQWLERATGRSASEIIGHSILDVGFILRPIAESAMRRAVDGAMVVLSNALHSYFIDIPPFVGYEGIHRMQQSVRVLPVPGDGAARASAVILIQDVTERVATENALRASMLEAQQANRAKAEFLAAMSHELRTPIGAMSGYADLIAEGIFGTITEAQQTSLLRIKTVGAHLLSIVEEILSFARIEAGRETLHLAEVDVSTVIDEAVNAVAPLATKKSLTLSYDRPPAPLMIYTDCVKLRQVLINLLGNGVKFTERGGVSVTVDASTESTIAVSVTDTGTGIAAEDQSRIFEPFVQVDGKLTRTHSGTGLGLALSRVLTQLLGGTLALTSTVGVGSTFVMTMPRVFPEEETEPTAPGA